MGILPIASTPRTGARIRQSGSDLGRLASCRPFQLAISRLALILCAAVGMSRIEVEKRLWARTTVMAALTIISIYINCSFSFVHQRTTSGAPLAKRVEFRHIQHTFYQLTRGRMTTDGS
jgi:hypothetical protein